MPLIALFTGMRLNEICQLDAADIQELEGVSCFVVARGERGPTSDKRLKTAASTRVIPVHPQLQEIGFLTFAERQRASGHQKLFPELELSGSGYYSDAFSKWFARFLTKCGAAEPKTCFHSFRHCYRDALREARIEHQIALALGGWTSGTSSDGGDVATNYGRGYRAPTLFDALRQISYPVSLSHLSEVTTAIPTLHE